MTPCIATPTVIAQQRRGTGELEVPETNHAPPSAAAPGSADRSDHLMPLRGHRWTAEASGPGLGLDEPHEDDEGHGEVPRDRGQVRPGDT